MSPQFVDYDADGQIDIVAGTFDGSPHVALGSEAGFRQPAQILDREGQRIALNQFWNFDSKRWEVTDRYDAEGHEPGKGHGTSAWVTDWDGDGDLDLLLGDHQVGYLYLRRNEGSRQQPRYALINVPVRAGGEPLKVPGTVATMRLLDWDRDGLTDLLCSSMGDVYGDGEGGGVYLFLNRGTKTSPEFGEAIVLVPASDKMGVDGPTRPDTGLYVDAADPDGDGDLDLVVGGYSHWKPTPPSLSDEQAARAEELGRQIDAISDKFAALNRAVSEAVESLDEEALEQRRAEILRTQSAERSALGERMASAREELEKLAPSRKRAAYVWLYENLTVGTTR